MSWLLRTFRGLSDDASASNLNQLRTNLNDHLRLHAHDGTPGMGSKLLIGLDYYQIVTHRSYTNSGWATITGDTSAAFRMYLATDNTNLGNTITFKTPLRGGTWRLDLLCRKASSYGIGTFSLDSTTIGTIDFYNSITAYDQQVSLTDITVPALGVGLMQELKISILTKNASSSAYGAGIQFIALRRTGS